MDAQATYETMMAMWGAVMGGGHLIYHAAGWLEGGLVASYEKVILDIEIIQNLLQFMRPINTNESDFAFDAAKEVKPGGHFFGCSHTMQHYKTAFYEPILSDCQNFETWQSSGSKTATMRATEIWQKALKEYQQPNIDKNIIEAMDEYVIKRKIEIGNHEP